MTLGCWLTFDARNHMLLTPFSSLAKVDHRLEEEEAEEDVSLAPSVKVLFGGFGLGNSRCITSHPLVFASHSLVLHHIL